MKVTARTDHDTLRREIDNAVFEYLDPDGELVRPSRGQDGGVGVKECERKMLRDLVKG